MKFPHNKEKSSLFIGGIPQYKIYFFHDWYFASESKELFQQTVVKTENWLDGELQKFHALYKHVTKYTPHSAESARRQREFVITYFDQLVWFHSYPNENYLTYVEAKFRAIIAMALSIYDNHLPPDCTMEYKTNFLHYARSCERFKDRWVLMVKVVSNDRFYISQAS